MKHSLFAPLIAASIFCASPSANAACHFSVKYPIVCEYPLPAALAWKELGIAKTVPSYIQKILQDEECGIPYTQDGDLKKAVIEEQSRARVATATGWVPVTLIEVNHQPRATYYIADAYLSGVCTKRKPDND